MQDDGHRVPRRALAGAAGLLPRHREELGRLHREQAGRADAGASVLLDERAADGEPRVPRLPHHEPRGLATTTRPARGRRPFERRQGRVRGCHGAGGATRTRAPPTTSSASRAVKAGAVGVAACARCHGPRQPLWPLLDAEHRFELGQQLRRALRSDRRHAARRRHVERLLRRRRGPRRRASSTRRCCSRRATARATRRA